MLQFNTKKLRLSGLVKLTFVTVDFLRALTLCDRNRPIIPIFSSSMLPAHEFAQAVRSHWHIENKLHWVLDVVFYDDYMRPRTNHGPANMATIRHFAINLIQGINNKNSLKVRREKLEWDEDYLIQTITASPCP